MSTNRLTESNTLERARLELKSQTKGLDSWERTRRNLLLSGRPAEDLSLGAKAATSKGFMGLAVKAHKTSENAQLSLSKDVLLAQANGAETKTLIRQASLTSAGAFETPDESGEYAPARRPLELLDVVRLGQTEEASVAYMRQTTYTPVAVETAEATSTTTGTKPEATLPFEQVLSPVESIPSWAPATRRALTGRGRASGAG